MFPLFISKENVNYVRSNVIEKTILKIHQNKYQGYLSVVFQYYQLNL